MVREEGAGRAVLVVDGVDELSEVDGEALREEGGAGLAVLRGLERGRSGGGLLDGSADVDDAVRFELEVAGLEAGELAPAESGSVDEGHDDRPPFVALVGHGGEQVGALLVGGEGGAGDEGRRLVASRLAMRYGDTAAGVRGVGQLLELMKSKGSRNHLTAERMGEPVLRMQTLTWHELPDYLLSRGTTSFTTEEAADLVGGSRPAAHQGLQRLIRKGEVFSPAQGFYVPIPPEYRAWGGSIPAAEFIDQMMRHLDRRYYVGLLSAAEIHGAAHQRPQVFQVMVDKMLRNRDHGRARLRFFVNRRIDDIPTVTSRTRTGDILVSTPEATALDLVTRPLDSAGLDNVATILVELVEDQMLDPIELAKVAEHFPVATVHRLGWLLDTFTEDFDSGPLAALVGSGSVTALDSQAGRRGTIDQRWRLIVNREIEPDV